MQNMFNIQNMTNMEGMEEGPREGLGGGDADKAFIPCLIPSGRMDIMFMEDNVR